MKSKDLVENVETSKDKVVNFAKSRVFDLLSMALIAAMAAISLGVIEFRTITWSSLLDMLIEMVPFYIVSLLLSMNNYTKGSFAGKATESYKNIVTMYSDLLNNLDGKMLGSVPEFCNEYNEKTLADRQRMILKRGAITYELFDKGNDNTPPLKTLTEKQLLKMYNKDVVAVIMQAKRCKIKRLNANILLGNNDNPDNTDLGPTESDLAKKRTAWYAGSYIVSVFMITLIGVKNVTQWGWAGFLFVLFKLLYIACMAYMKYFRGYKDITVHVFNHISRKCSILEEFKYWYSCKSSMDVQITLPLEILQNV